MGASLNNYSELSLSGYSRAKKERMLLTRSCYGSNNCVCNCGSRLTGRVVPFPLYRRVLAMVACKAHNLEVGSSNLPSATIGAALTSRRFFFQRCTAELRSDSRDTNLYLLRLWRLDVNISRTL